MTDYTQATGTWAIDPSHTTLGFSARHAMVSKVRGQFTEVDGTITLDGANPAGSTVEVSIKTASITTQNDDRDNHLRSGDFLDAQTFPELTFKATTIRDGGNGEFTLSGNLTIKGVSRPVELDVTYVGVSQDPYGNARVGFEGHTEISRKDFGLTWNVALETGGVLVADKIRIDIDVEAVKK